MMIRNGGFVVVVVLVDVLGGDGRKVAEGGGEDVGTDLAEVELAHKHGSPSKKKSQRIQTDHDLRAAAGDD